MSDQQTLIMITVFNKQEQTVVKKSGVLPLQRQDAAQVSVQHNAGYKCRRLVRICVGKGTQTGGFTLP